MIDNTRLVEILQPFGKLVEIVELDAGAVRGAPVLQEGVWIVLVDRKFELHVEETALPPALAQMLALFVDTMAAADPRQNVQRLLSEWSADGGEWDGTVLAQHLQELGWAQQGTVVVAMEPVMRQEEAALLLEDAVQLLGELLDGEEAFVTRQGAARIYLLLANFEGEDASLPAWLGTLETELYLPFRAAVSQPVAQLRDVQRAREEAEFALEAGKRYRGQETIHEFSKLGVARLLHGLPRQVSDTFLQEVLPEDVVNSLTPELRETIFAFLEHGQQMADTARFLYIHRNTLLYRLERIHELTGYDIRKPLQGWTLWVALTLIRSL